MTLIDKDYLSGEDVDFDLCGDHAPDLVVLEVVGGTVAPARRNSLCAYAVIEFLLLVILNVLCLANGRV